MSGEEINDEGPWIAWRRPDGRVVIQSDDFMHDVSLIVSGDFADDAQNLRYAEMIRDKLNSAQDMKAEINRLQSELDNVWLDVKANSDRS